jgi:hypothetical protein
MTPFCTTACSRVLAAAALVGFPVACSSPDPSTDGLRLRSQTVDPQNGPPGLHGGPEPGEAPMLGLHMAKEARPGGSSSSPNMTWHGGAIMTDSAVTPVFWGQSWASAVFVEDKIDGLDRLYTGLSATPYAESNAEYAGSNGEVGTQVSYGGHVIDTSAAPSHAPRTSTILTEVCKAITSPVANGYYPVYVDTKRGGAGYCAWHSHGACSGVPVQFAFFFSLDGDSGCDPRDTQTTHSQGLAALANVSGHEWSEAVTDPRNGGWWDSGGYENSDKCAWTFPYTPVVLGGESWKIQGNWSNAAYSARSGYLNRSGQAGCLPNF